MIHETRATAIAETRAEGDNCCNLDCRAFMVSSRRERERKEQKNKAVPA